MTDCILSIDAGSTVFKYALIATDGTILTDVFKQPINPKGSRGEIYDIYKKLIERAKEMSDSLTGIGISMPGPFDYDNGISYMKHKFQSIYGVRLKDKIKEFCDRDIPIWFCPGTNAFLAGEYAYGAGKGYSGAIGVTIGTGVGIAVIENGTMLLNENKGSKEVIYNLPCNEGILEDYVSGKGIAEYYKRLACVGNKTITAKNVGMLAGVDEYARKTFDEIGFFLGKTLSGLVEKYHSEVVIVGGQVANSFSYMKDGIERGISSKSCKVVCADDIDNSAIKGILCLKKVY